METIEIITKEGEWLSSVLKKARLSDAPKEEWLSEALKCFKLGMIPPNTILNKTLTGLGATYSEIYSKRNSIIIEPNLPVILGKSEEENVKGICGKITLPNIKKYFKDDNIPYKKFLTTPESFKKIEKAAKELEIDIYKEYFCLFDECEKITQDVIFRKKISHPIPSFFKFENKAFVSATPLKMTHPEFERQNFYTIKIQPDYDYKKDLKLIVTNSYYKTLKKELEHLKDSTNICIFFNVVEGIYELINNLKIDDYKVFCSEDGVEKLQKIGIGKAYSKIDYPFAKYNFFTCRFYSALDIELRNQKPDILMLTDLREALFTTIDPFTQAIQIQGRFRKTKKAETITYNSLTHITTINPDMHIKSAGEIKSRVERLEKNHSILTNEFALETDISCKEIIQEDLLALGFSNLLDENNNLDYFAVDNLYNEERVKSYYTSAMRLRGAYEETGFFNLTFNDETEPVGVDDIEKINKKKIKMERRQLMAKSIDNIYKEKEINRECIELIRREDEGFFMIDAYNKLGLSGLEKTQYKKNLIEKEIIKYDKLQAKETRLNKEIVMEVRKEFELGIYIGKEDIKERLQAIYRQYSIKCKVTLKTILDYYTVSESNSRKEPSYKLNSFKDE